jgi:hypothetical protein
MNQCQLYLVKTISSYNMYNITPFHIYNAQSVSLCTLKNCPQMGVLNVQRCKTIFLLLLK